MDWIQFFGLLVPMIAFFGFLYKEIKEWRKETRDETTAIRNEMNTQSARTDRLYEMFIDARKDMDQIRKEVDQKFYDMLKAKNDPKTNP